MKKIILAILVFTAISLSISNVNARGFDRNDGEVETILNQTSFEDKINKVEANYNAVIKRINTDKNISITMKALLEKQALEKKELTIKYIEDNKNLTDSHRKRREEQKLAEIENI